MLNEIQQNVEFLLQVTVDLKTERTLPVSWLHFILLCSDDVVVTMYI